MISQKYALTALLLCLVCNTPSAEAGIQAATADQCVAMIAAGIKKEGECIAGKTIIDDATEALIHASAGAKSPAAFLEDHACKNTHIACLDPQFSALVQQFYLAGEAVGKQEGWQMPRLTDGWRSPESQLKAVVSGASKVGPCGSPHNYGLAVDFNDPPLNKGLSPAMKWMRANARNYGLEVIGEWDPAHFQIKGWANRSVARGQCITGCTAPASGKIQSCTGGGGGGGILANTGNALSNAFSQLTRPFSSMMQPEPVIPPPPPPAALPVATSTMLKDAFRAPATQFPTSTSAQFPSTQNAKQPEPKTSEDILTQIAVGNPNTPPTPATTTRPLTAEEQQRLHDQQVLLQATTPASNVVPTYTPVIPPASSFAGFSPSEFAVSDISTRAWYDLYITTLTRVALAIGETIRIMKGEPSSNTIEGYYE